MHNKLDDLNKIVSTILALANSPLASKSYVTQGICNVLTANLSKILKSLISFISNLSRYGLAKQPLVIDSYKFILFYKTNNPPINN